MRALLTLAGLLVVLAAIAVSARHQLDASRPYLPASAPADGSAVAPGGAVQVTPAQYQRQIQQALQDGAQREADRAASAGDADPDTK